MILLPAESRRLEALAREQVRSPGQQIAFAVRQMLAQWAREQTGFDGASCPAGRGEDAARRGAEADDVA